MLNSKSQQEKVANKSGKIGFFLTPIQRKFLQEKLAKNLRPEYRRRIEIMLLADMGQSQSQICAALNCSQETARYWIAKVQTRDIYSWNTIALGRPHTINDKYLERLRELVNHSPQEYNYIFKQWTARWLNEHLKKEFDIEISDRHINRLLKNMGLSTRKKITNSEQRSNLLKTSDGKIVIRNLSSVGARQNHYLE